MVNSNSSETSLALKKITDRLILVFRLVGLWPSKEPSIFYWIYGAFVILTGSMLFTLTMLIQLVGFTKMEDLTENSFMTLTELGLCVKIINFFVHFRSMQSHVTTINGFELRTDAERTLFIKRTKFVLLVYMMDFYMTNTSHVLNIIQLIAAKERQIEFPAWHPIDWENDTRSYWIVLIYQFYAMTITTNLQVAIQQYPSLMFAMVSIQMEILSMRLQNLGHNKIHGDRITNISNKEGLENITTSLKDCIKTHHKILEYVIFFSIIFVQTSFLNDSQFERFAKKLQRDFSLPFFVQICLSAIVLCGLTNEVARVIVPNFFQFSF